MIDYFVYLFWYMAACVAVSHVASSRGRSGILWGIGSIVFSPLVMGYLAACLPLVDATIEAKTPKTHVKCPECRELVSRYATKCPHCHTTLEPT